MFTRMAKGFLWILVVAVVISSIALPVVLESGVWFFIALGGGLIILRSFGMFIELCNNILDIKQAIKRGDVSINNQGSSYGANVSRSSQTYGNNTQAYGNNAQSYGYSNQSYGYNNQSYGYNNQMYGNNRQGGMLAAAAKQADEEKKKMATSGGWYCKYCGAKNKPHDQYCKDCGKEK